MRMKKRFLLLFATLISVFNIAAAQQTAGQDPKAGKILDEMSKKYREMSGFKAKFSYELENKDYKMKEKAEGEIAVKGSKYNLKVGDQEIINNGTTVWTYFKDANEVNISDYNPDPNDITPDRIYTMYKKGYKYIHMGEQNVDGVQVDIIDLEPVDRKSKVNKIRLIVSKKDRSLKSWKIFENTGTVYTYTVKSFTPNVAMEDSYFNFDKSKHPGVEINDLRY
jgi:outer membrane lipoprotein carrier protein